ncbi:rod shape-determining protein MreD [Texcoconibacillus texcoconensis]|uniref:Rod shape-determining protein MreD n=1 Tax=Texcoconibacillus texcoconensis TaxID=1095777 RepID=A0A840QSN9_9BACI|nr:rod shape-determining protein MreD [Texcoconibacillus texcoconensis]MBB5174385.1 rod shape-determining protein MreD [Texcoconibacillus texcoconensis]
MNRYLIIIVLFLMFIIEGTWFQYFLADRFMIEFQWVPRFVLVLIIYIGLFHGRLTGVIYALAFGILYDVVYGPFLGVYTFSFGLISYILCWPLYIVRRNVSLNIVAATIAVLFIEYFVYLINDVLGLAMLSHEAFIYERLLPTIGINFVFAVMISYPWRKLLEEIRKRMNPQES